MAVAAAAALGLGLDAMIPVLGAAILLPAAGEATLRLHSHRENTDAPMTVTPDVDDLLQRVMEQDLDLRTDLDLELLREITKTTTSETDGSDSSEQSQQTQSSSLDTWSVVWYCGMFAAFTSLFLIMPCSQVLCRSGLIGPHGDPRLRPRTTLAFQNPSGYGTPPPPYKQFAPPSYEDVVLDLQQPGKVVPEEKLKEGAAVIDVYVIPLRPESADVSRPPATEAVA